MVTMQTVLEQLTGTQIVDALVGEMAKTFPDFAQAQKRYNDAVRTLRQELGEDSVPSVDDEITAIQRQTASNLFYSGILGIKANLDNFIDPVVTNFLDTDFETYLREQTARRLPEYESAQKVRERFFSILSPAQRKIHKDVTSYVCHLETVGPKLAHYYGYLLGNTLLSRVVPGYHPDPVLTIQYRAMLENYFGKRFEQAPEAAFSEKRQDFGK